MKLNKTLGVVLFLNLVNYSFAYEAYHERINYKYNKDKFTKLTVFSENEIFNDSNNSLKNLFDNQNSTKWKTEELPKDYIGESPSLIIDFNENVYVLGIRILPCGDVDESLPINLFVAKKVSKVDHINSPTLYKIKNINRYYDINFTNDNKNDFFPTKRIVIEVIQPYKSTKVKQICFSDLHITMSKKPNYKPQVSFKKVMAYIKKNSNYMYEKDNWVFHKNVDPKNSQSYFYDLIYYAYLGNKEAQNIVLSAKDFEIHRINVIRDIYKPLIRSKLYEKK